jgi:hypothetical protein
MQKNTIMMQTRETKMPIKYKMAFSHTAPRIEFQELEDEIQRLSDKERKELERDLYGKYDNETSMDNTHCIASLVELRMLLVNPSYYASYERKIFILRIQPND